jgi:Membrane bound O-acyl transferase family
VAYPVVYGGTKPSASPLSDTAFFLASDVLRARRGTLIARYLTLFLTFFVSGLLHLMADLTRGTSWQASGALSSFYTHAAGIMLEDVVQALLPLAAAHGWSSKYRKAVGYVWVLAFLLWSTSMWQYPSLSVDTGLPMDALLPFSVVGSFVGRRKGIPVISYPNW